MENIRDDCLLVIKKEIKLTKEYLTTLNVHISHNTDLLDWFRELCKKLTKLIIYLTNYHQKCNKGTNYKENMLLYLQQLLTYLSLLINVFVKESEVEESLTDLRCFCNKQMIYSLNGIEETVFKPVSEGTSVNFVKWMDSALDKLNEINYLNKRQESEIILSETKVLFEEVLSHAMSIAQVTLLDDYKKIRGSSQSVLDSFDSLTNEVSKPIINMAMLNLFIDDCTNKLCSLECKVNTAVLKLSLKVFSEYIIPLEAVHSFCFDKINRSKQEELDNLIVDFDLHVDRILQIGLFAVSCTSCSNNCIRIRNCLASLEALETELVPAFTSVLNDVSISKIHLSLVLKEYWLRQAYNLKKLICLIIDPSAFCEVIYEENKILVDEISESIKSKALMDKNLFEKLMRQSKVLEEFIKIVLEEEQENNIDEIKLAYMDFKWVLHEVKSAFDILPNESGSHLRIIKRCKILLSSTKSLWNCFIDENVENQNSCLKEQLDEQKNTVEQTSKPVLGNAFLDHIIKRGKDILKDRSILYQTSVRNVTSRTGPSGKGKKTPLQETKPRNLKLAHLRNRTFIHSSYKNKTNSQLQMTDILNELNNLTNASLTS